MEKITSRETTNNGCYREGNPINNSCEALNLCFYSFYFLLHGNVLEKRRYWSNYCRVLFKFNIFFSFFFKCLTENRYCKLLFLRLWKLFLLLLYLWVNAGQEDMAGRFFLNKSFFSATLCSFFIILAADQSPYQMKSSDGQRMMWPQPWKWQRHFRTLCGEQSERFGPRLSIFLCQVFRTTSDGDGNHFSYAQCRPQL